MQRMKLKKLPTTDVAETDYHRRDDNADYGELGIQVADLDAREARRYDIEAHEGVLVIDVDPRSDAAREGLRPGDVVVRVGDKKVANVRGYRNAIRPYQSGDTVLLRVARGQGFLFFGVEKS